MYLESYLHDEWIIQLSHSTREADWYNGAIYYIPPEKVWLKLQKQYCFSSPPDIVLINNWVLTEFACEYRKRPWCSPDIEDLIRYTCYKLEATWLEALPAKFPNTPNEVTEILSVNQIKYGVENNAYVRGTDLRNWLSQRS